MNWFKKILPSRIKTGGNGRRTVPEGVWTKCDDCGAVLYREELDKNLEVCPKCNHHMKIGARSRLEYFLDEETGIEKGTDKQIKRKVKKYYELHGYAAFANSVKKLTGTVNLAQLETHLRESQARVYEKFLAIVGSAANGGGR